MNVSKYLERIRASRVYDVAEETALDAAPRLSARLGNRVFMKREDLQPVFSFKLRGAYEKIASLDAAALKRGVICSSAGNHAQGVALAAQRCGTRAVVVMPVTTPEIKIAAVRALGGEVILHGDTYDDAQAHASDLRDRDNLSFVHPFDDPAVIAGQGTIGAEILRQAQQQQLSIDAVCVPIGGGGLISGIALYLKSVAPTIRIIGVEPVDAASMLAARNAGEPTTLAQVGIFADGVAVRRVGDLTFALCEAFVDDLITVDTDQTCAAVQDIFEETRSIVEPAGALAVAGTKKYLQDRKGETVVAINCGANVNFDRLRHIAERAAIGEQREMLLAAKIPERPGSFRQFCETLGRRSITEFNYRYNDDNDAMVFAGIELRRGVEERQALLKSLQASGYDVVDLSDDELAKIHIRHMVGGAAPREASERLFRFEFPERPGALLDFLDAIGERWNISLFHYHNHGSDYGRVLAGIDVPDTTASELGNHLDTLGYFYTEETHNPAYTLFLR